MKELELSCFQIISSAGGAKSKCFEAIALAKRGNFEAARERIKEAKEIFIVAHKVHGELVSQEASGDVVMISLLLVHSEDQLMGAELSREFAEEIISLYEKNSELEKLLAK